MNTADLTNLLIGIVISLIIFVAKLFIQKLDKFEKIVETILLSDVGMKKDIENIKEDLKDHETRIQKLEN
jgi:hypothetical protein